LELIKNSKTNNMKTKSIILIALLILSVKSVAQVVHSNESQAAITAGILQGGGSLIGADLEFMPTRSIGLQVGAGFVGYGAGVNFHFKPGVRSSFLSLQYWHQGMTDSNYQSVVGPTFVYRAPKWFTAQIGAGYLLSGAGATYSNTRAATPVILLYSIGAYFPL
jgi:hypothetical protein